MEYNSLNNKVALVTGASRGIGRVVALTLAAHGARLALVARSEANLSQVQSEIEDAGGEAISISADLTREEDVIGCVQDAAAHFDRLDILVNNAGIGVFGHLAETSTADWDSVMDINARAPFLMCRESIPHLRQQQRSYIINISSVVGVKGYINQATYSASKHALMGMTRSMAKELQADGIRVHAICPGGVDTEMATQARPDLDRSVLIQPQEIADIVLFLIARPGNAMIDQIDVRRGSSTPWA